MRDGPIQPRFRRGFSKMAASMDKPRAGIWMGTRVSHGEHYTKQRVCTSAFPLRQSS